MGAERILHTAEGELDYYIPHAHSLVFQTAADLGLVGLAGGVVILIFGRPAGVVIAARRRSRRPRWAVAAVLAAVYFGVHQLFDLLVNMPAALFAFAFPIAWLDANAGPAGDGEVAAPSDGGGASASRRRWLVLGAGALAVAVAVGWSLASERSALALDGAKTAFDAGDTSSAARLAADAVALDPSIPPDQLLLALAAIRDGQASLARPALEAVVRADGLPPA